MRKMLQPSRFSESQPTVYGWKRISPLFSSWETDMQNTLVCAEKVGILSRVSWSLIICIWSVARIVEAVEESGWLLPQRDRQTSRRGRFVHQKVAAVSLHRARENKHRELVFRANNEESHNAELLFRDPSQRKRRGSANEVSLPVGVFESLSCDEWGETAADNCSWQVQVNTYSHEAFLFEDSSSESILASEVLGVSIDSLPNVNLTMNPVTIFFSNVSTVASPHFKVRN